MRDCESLINQFITHAIASIEAVEVYASRKRARHASAKLYQVYGKLSELCDAENSLRQLTKHEHPAVRIAAAGWLAESSPAEAIPVLRELQEVGGAVGKDAMLLLQKYDHSHPPAGSDYGA